MDAFKFATDETWVTAWKTRVEPFLDEYVKPHHLIKTLVNEPNMALYDNYFSTM